MEDASKVNRLLMFAVERADHREIERLLQNGADPNYYNSCAANGKCTPLHVAIVVADPVAVRMLLRKGANRDTTNNKGLSPLDMAQLLEYSEIASLLINHSKEPSSEDGPQTSKWFYTRRSGTSSIAGQMYEYKLLALVLLRLKKGPYQFLLGSNITGIGNFDDLCVRYRQVGETSFKYLFIQAKHREDPAKKKVTKELLLNLDCKDSSEYSMHKHFEQYLKIREQFTKTSNDEFFAGNFENLNIEFVLYTTAHSDLETNDQINSEFLLETSADGKVYMVESTDEIIQSLCAHVNEAKVEQTWKNEKPIEKSGFKQKLAIDFLKKFRVYHSQAMEHEVGEIVGAELDGKSDSWQLLNLIYLDLVQKYWMRKDKIVYLTEFCRFLEEAEQIVADTSLLSHLTSIFFNKVKSFELIFSNDAIVELNLDSFLSDCSRIFLNIHSNAPEISFANICQNMMQRFGNNLAHLQHPPRPITHLDRTSPGFSLATNATIQL
ncbi:uncharacterized protein LOC120416910 [Culex pipiens pallens]|uniref:uncharacterized protein LOC120416910 n=1 Tax=Culex pipiens pallens TaxID=42434 RepID=UPI0022AB04C7|nr:uncharacterized protein LOC120416910 [Culex pipiens pallens]